MYVYTREVPQNLVENIQLYKKKTRKRECIKTWEDEVSGPREIHFMKNHQL